MLIILEFCFAYLWETFFHLSFNNKIVIRKEDCNECNVTYICATNWLMMLLSPVIIQRLKTTTGNVTTNPSACRLMVIIVSVWSVVQVTDSIALSKVSASRLCEADSSTLAIGAVLVSHILASVAAIAVPVNRTVVAILPVTSGHG